MRKRWSKVKQTLEASSAAASPTERAGKNRRKTSLFLIVFFGLFLAAGLAFGYFVFLRPAWQSYHARNWPSVPCVIVSSEVSVSTDSDGDTYRVDIVYQYTVNGQTYTADRYEFLRMHSSGRSGKEAVVRQYPPGSRQLCYFNPADPSEAVIHRGMSRNMLFAFIPGIFVVVGAGGIGAGIWNLRRGHGVTAGASRSPRAADSTADELLDWLPENIRARLLDDAPVGRVREDDAAVRPESSPLAKLLGLALFALIWNGVITGFVILMINDGAPVMSRLILIPFVLVGLGLLLGVIHRLLGLSNPQLQLRVEPTLALPGDAMNLMWTIRGRTERINQLTLTVEGVEHATYTRGTDTYHDEHVFFTREVYAHSAAAGRDPLPRDDTATLTLPVDAMHCFESPHNAVRWRVKVHGSIKRWPDVKQTYPLAVLPASLADRLGRRPVRTLI